MGTQPELARWMWQACPPMGVFRHEPRCLRRSLGGLAWLLAVAAAETGCSGPQQGPAQTGGHPGGTAGRAAATAAADVEGETVSDEEYARRYETLRGLADGPLPQGPALGRVRAELGRIANRARDRHLRANAAVLLGSIEARAGRIDAAVAMFRHAMALVPDDAGPAMALAVALGRAGRYGEAAQAQATAARLDPDNLENWLLLGELHTKAGHRDEAAEAYAAYELRRKGLLDGLTARGPDGAYLRPAPERAGCARALAAATDQGTARGLLYALATEPDPDVRIAVVEAMGHMRLADFLAPLRRARKTEGEPRVREVIDAVIAHIEADPVAPSPRP